MECKRAVSTNLTLARPKSVPIACPPLAPTSNLLVVQDTSQFAYQCTSASTHGIFRVPGTAGALGAFTPSIHNDIGSTWDHSSNHGSRRHKGSKFTSSPRRGSEPNTPPIQASQDQGPGCSCEGRCRAPYSQQPKRHRDVFILPHSWYV